MKYLSTIAFSLILLFSTLSLQGQGIGGGLSVGAIASQIDGDQWGGYNKIGYHIGGYAYYDFSDFLALQVEILHTHRGSREVNDGYGQISMNFIDVPLLLRFHPINTGNTNVYGEIGPSVNMLLSARNGFEPLVLDQTQLYRRFSGEFNMGGTVMFTDNFGFFARWTIGFTNLLRTYPPWFTIHYFTVGGRLNFK